MNIKRRKFEKGAYCTVFALEVGNKCDLLEFLTEVQRNHRPLFVKAMRMIKRLATDGPMKNEQQCRCVGDGMFELKVRNSNDSIRVFFFFDGQAVVICTHGVTKENKKVQSQDIENAKKYRDQYLDHKRVYGVVESTEN